MVIIPIIIKKTSASNRAIFHVLMRDLQLKTLMAECPAMAILTKNKNSTVYSTFPPHK